MKAITLRVVFGLLVVAAIVLTIVELNRGDEPEGFRPPLEQAREDLGEAVPISCRVVGLEVEAKVCEFGDPEGTPVLLFGDSHALQWSPALVPLAKERGWKLMTLLRAGCPIADVETKPHCPEWRRRAMEKIPSLKPRHIIISTSIGGRYRLSVDGKRISRDASEIPLQEGMERTLRQLQATPGLAAEDGLILIRDQVRAPFVPAECILENDGDPQHCEFPNQRQWAPGFDWVAAKRVGVETIIDPTRLLCEPEICSPVEGKILKYRDSDHITGTYARTATDWFGDRIGIR